MQQVSQKFKEDFLKELNEHTNNFEATSSIFTGYFNEEMRSKSSQEFMIESWLSPLESDPFCRESKSA